MSFYAISALVNALTSLILGFLVLSRDKRNRINITFALFALAITIWSIGYFFWQIATNEAGAIMWTRIFMAGAIFIPVFYFHFTLSFLRITALHRWSLVIAYIFVAIFFVLNFTSQFVAGVAPKLTFPFWPVPGMLYHPFLFMWLFYVAFSTSLLYADYHTASGPRHHQLRYILIGMVIGFIGGITNYLLWYDIPIPPVGNILVSAYVIMVGYGILKHRLFDIKVVATELLVIALWMFLLIRMFLAADVGEQITEGFLLAATVVAGVLLIRSVGKEVEAREEIEKLAINLEKANKRLKLLDEQKSEFVSIASHQLRSPLTAIKGYASLLLEGAYGKMSAKVTDPIYKILASSQSLVNVVEDFLNVARIEQGRMQYNFAPVDINTLTQKIIDELKPNMDEKKLTLVFKVMRGKENYVQADEGKIRQVILNVIDNAIKFTPKGSIVISISK
ncbi:MAG: hypothetical protein NUV42_02130, partial [Candidatus Yonathbacteria bacterium]|nr:hypothetical protein [Candidatus Yonathbacteria bacterium]